MSAKAKPELPSDFAGDDRQFQKFVESARELGCDEDEGRWNEKLKKVVRPKPAPDPTSK